MQTHLTPSETQLSDDLSRAVARTRCSAEVVITLAKLDDKAIMGVLCDLFAGRSSTAFGEGLDCGPKPSNATPARKPHQASHSSPSANGPSTTESARLA